MCWRRSTRVPTSTVSGSRRIKSKQRKTQRQARAWDPLSSSSRTSMRKATLSSTRSRSPCVCVRRRAASVFPCAKTTAPTRPMIVLPDRPTAFRGTVAGHGALLRRPIAPCSSKVHTAVLLNPTRLCAGVRQPSVLVRDSAVGEVFLIDGVYVNALGEEVAPPSASRLPATLGQSHTARSQGHAGTKTKPLG